ncbi:uncharacterized protein I303_107583 [Kwoniella dejecticola CBS 10117]|uniref:SH3 domain-containing protein n=1 Tax=Kwoniella dejecticola CBS 10117 TaxID=1296121 RepID=A0A1A5ZV50_9TREE|nr:uncharacterized protein I303_07593 [Kwoniella dejecticola CBS 10117]OBR81683.1 hypothetical protein I303_07593 [Kwoniella dejecticola CBS 10117]
MFSPRVIVLFGAIMTLVQGVDGQQLQGDCLRLLGSLVCPAYQYAWINPSNLSLAYPFFANVNSVASFDSAALAYFSNPYQYTNTKFRSQELGCSNASEATIRWEKTVLCSQWVNEKWSLGCTALNNGTTAATSMKMVCQQTCLQFSASETAIVNSTEYCPGTDLTAGTREATLTKDFVDCTNWTTYSTNDTATCVRGEDNEGNCGYGTSTAQLCEFCKGDTPDDCCYSGSTDMTVCGFTLPVRVNGTTTSIPSNTVTGPTQSITSTNSAINTGAPTGTTANDTAGSTSKLRGGRLAGVIVGSVLGGLLLLLLLLLLLFCIRRKRSNRNNQRDSVSSFAASQARPNSTANPSGGIFGFLSPGHGTNGGKTSGQSRNNSEKGLLSRNSNSLSQSNFMGGPNNNSTPTMGGDTFYSPSTHTGYNLKSSEGLPLTAAAAAAGAGMGGGGAGNRNSVGTILPRVKDENQLGDIWIEPGMEVSVLWPYTATLPDELDLRPGMKLRVVRLFDDAWGTAEVISTNGNGTEEGSKVGKQGAFPIVCVSEGSSLGSSNSHSSNSSH